LAGTPGEYTGGTGTFASATLINALVTNLPSVSAYAAFLTANTTKLANGVASGIRSNYFFDNPLLNSAFIFNNNSRSYYDSFQFELRRRLSKGLLFQGSYVFSKSLTNSFASSSFGQKNYISLHNPELDRGVSPFDINHSLKANFIYEFPVGKGQRFL